MQPSKIVGLLLKSHYLADDFPAIITTAPFAKFCVNNYKTLETLKALLGRTTLYGTFSAPRTTTSRRVMALPHPTSQLALSQIIASNRDEIRKAIDATKVTLYSTAPKISENRAFLGLDFKERTKRQAEILARYPVVLVADIQNFFHTIYTHSIPWAILGKERVKDVREGQDKVAKSDLEGHWSSQLDLAIRQGNSRETFGIPVGPDTSRVIAELLLSGLHANKAFSEIVEGRNCYRLVDDFFIGFEDEVAAQRCLDILRRVLWSYNLHLNETKTRIVRSGSLFDSGWKYELQGVLLPVRSWSRQREAVQYLLELTLRLCESENDSRPAAFLCGRLLNLEIKRQNFIFVRDCLLRLGRDFTPCLKFVASFVVEYRDELSNQTSLPVIEEWTRLLLAVNARRGHDFEVAWALIIRAVLGLPVKRSFMDLSEGVSSPVVLAILGLLSKRSLLDGAWDDWRGPSVGEGTIANGRNWLPHYEAVLRNWTNDSAIIKEIKGDPLFSRLLKAKVTFLDDTDFPMLPFAGSEGLPPQPSGGGGSRGVVRPRRNARRERGFDIYG